ncbi:DUF262 domain-containing protein [Fulvivirgaceae bacterium PWU5]|uniref:DUF262 domain-containing protein n=1 Tax=Dawidia cretensis TaxID=2782350 RepID=A0AAP2E0F1_9BACT|nr:DUF262 domain-containing protein [Dawidia cretensis]MBT1710751.1 DUF262 domain-containing protein [Dawidia cretensis]
MSLKGNLDNLQTKAKERTVKTQSIEYDLETLVKKIQKGIIKLDPDYQRRHRWDESTSSRLMESLILNIPIPIIYLSYDIDVDTNEEGARYSVIDGQQRLTAILQFFEGTYALQNLDILDDLEGCFYKDLPPFLLRRLEERTIKCLRIDSTIDPQVKYDIFERLNSGAVKLESHELRNAIHRGPFNDLCKKLAKDTDFRRLIQIPEDDPENNSKVKKMEDVELVLRFFSLMNDNYKNYKKSKDKQFKDFLSENLAVKNSLPTVELKKSSDTFIKVIQLIRLHFGDLAFAKYKFENGKFVKQSNFNAAVYDALAVGIVSEVDLEKSHITDGQVSAFKELFKDSAFHDSVSGSILDNAKIITRIEAARKVFKK